MKQKWIVRFTIKNWYVSYENYKKYIYLTRHGYIRTERRGMVVRFIGEEEARQALSTFETTPQYLTIKDKISKIEVIPDNITGRIETYLIAIVYCDSAKSRLKRHIKYLHKDGSISKNPTWKKGWAAFESDIQKQAMQEALNNFRRNNQDPLVHECFGPVKPGDRVGKFKIPAIYDTFKLKQAFAERIKESQMEGGKKLKKITLFGKTYVSIDE